MIAAVMVTTNIGTDLTTAYAAESSDSVTFEMSGSGLVTAIEEAIAAGNPLQGDIDFTNGRTEQFEALFYGEGNIYDLSGIRRRRHGRGAACICPASGGCG